MLTLGIADVCYLLLRGFGSPAVVGCLASIVACHVSPTDYLVILRGPTSLAAQAYISFNKRRWKYSKKKFICYQGSSTKLYTEASVLWEKGSRILSWTLAFIKFLLLDVKIIARSHLIFSNFSHIKVGTFLSLALVCYDPHQPWLLLCQRNESWQVHKSWKPEDAFCNLRVC